MKILPPVSISARGLLAGRWDLLAAILVFGAIAIIGEESRSLVAPLSTLKSNPLSLSPWALPGYALRTTLRMLAAMVVSLVFTFTYASWAAKSARAGTLLIPVLDILQSIPILGYLSVTYLFFLSLAPGKVLGAEFAAIFTIFSSQAWNMAFSFYQSLRTVPVELEEAGRVFGLSAWARFWRIETPFAMPSLVWNMMMSMSGSWFFVVWSEAITVGHTTITLPGVGSYIALALARRDLGAVGWAILTMLIVILIYDQLLFRPLITWSDRFRFEQEQSEEPPQSWVLTMFRRSRLIDAIAAPFKRALRWSYRIAPPPPVRLPLPRSRLWMRLGDFLWYGIILVIIYYALWRIVAFVGQSISWPDVFETILLGLATLVRVLVLIAIASAIWTPVGIYVGLRPKLARRVQPVAQFLAAFPANLLFPLAVSVIVTYSLNPDIWLSPLMVLGTQWYILFNVIAGASGLPSELRDAGANLQVRGWLWWKRIGLPGVFPFYVTGAITASGGSWNAAIAAEWISWGNRVVRAHGLGAYIQDATTAGNYQRIVLGIAVMGTIVAITNRVFWRPLYWYAERKYRLS
ncbi:MAG TPA: ABC transporter permease subunit [Rhizomicrobium sp.]|jgi:NitT/TauT family transport system permease protein|nr:ABC transporter permease subunit [Rhizomicrobium sp.]